MKTRTWLVPLLCVLSFVAGTWFEDKSREMNISANICSDGLGVLMRQQEAWNKGDLAGFLSGYEMSEDITFFTDDKITKGWVAINDKYQKSYGQPGRMGKLEFTELSIQAFSPEYALARGRWTVSESEKPGTGLFTLIIRKTENGYKVVHDHTSAKKDR